MKTIRLVLLFALISTLSQAQISHGGQPASWTQEITTDVIWETLEKPDLAPLHREDEMTDKHKDIPYRYGVDLSVDLSSSTNGVWTELENGDRIWQLGIKSEGALTLNFVLDAFEIPVGGQVFVYSPDRKQMLGSFTHENKSKINSLAIGLLKGDEAVIEYLEPAGVAGEGYIHISNIVHGYRSVLGGNIVSEEKAGPYGNSGACNINVNCPEGIPFDIQKRSVALIVVGNNSVCSGAMINTTSTEQLPYFLTANHCLPFSENTLNNWIFIFNHETPDCEGTEDGPTNQTVSGSDLLASNDESDFALLELHDDVPASYNVCYSGWDATDALNVTNAYGIHHPSGDYKKICFEDDAPFHANQGSFVNQVWFINQWELGVTEGGSSGSPLFNQSGNIIGQLAGGLAACSGTVNNGQEDYYGRFGVSWDFSSNNDEQLEHWLDPAGTGQMIVPNSCAILVDNNVILSQIGDVESRYCELETIEPFVTVINTGLNNVTSVELEVITNGGSPETIEVNGLNLGNGESTNIDLGALALVYGENTIQVSVVTVNGSEDVDPNGNTVDRSMIAYEESQDITLEITFDQYPGETSWFIMDESNDILVSGGGYSQPGATISEEICFGEGCYTFVIEDSWGDGICCGEGNGSYTLTDEFGTVLGTGGQFGDMDEVEFCIIINSVANAELLNDINVYPNPATDAVRIEIGDLAGESTSLTLVDIQGRKVAEKNIGIGETMIKLETNDFAPGLYLIQINTVNHGALTKKLLIK